MRHPRLLEQMAGHGVDVVVLFGENNIAYATGNVAPSQEPGRAGATRAVAVLTAEEEAVFRPGALDLEDVARKVATAVADFPGTLAVDQYPSMAVHAALASRQPVDAGPLLTAAKIVKTPEEIARIRRAQEINEEAIDAVRPLAVPGARETDLTAAFFRRIFELGATGNTVDPIWNVVPRSIDEGPFTLTGHLPFPVPTTGRVFEAGDVIFSDTGIDYEGWASDFGRTWIVGAEPDARQRSQFRRWLEVCEACYAAIGPGASAWDVARAAAEATGGDRPWLPHFYVAHGIGTESAELPFCGTDLGAEIESQVVLAPGTVLVIEPVIWEDGHGGYRGEEVVVVTDTGCERLTTYTYAPYE